MGNIQKALTDERKAVGAVENIGNENYTENKVANDMDNAKSSSYFTSSSSLNSDNGESVSIADEESTPTANDTDDNTSIGMSDVVGAVAELVLQPYAISSVGGGGGSSRSDDDDKDKKKYKPRRK